ncbi:MAG TPA: aldo/keto reductase [Polyangiaceae bacterium]
MSSADAPRPTNRLANETSPYLLQHAHNPVDWYPWGPDALERAQREDKPILLSIGYAACHWCHVMERESFENERIAALMNQSFVCIKVDREERPDIDDIYMAATVAMSGSGGWPMTVFLMPDQQPFFAGTYFPPENKHGRPGFATLLERIAELWQSDRSALLKQAQELTEHVRDQAQAPRALSVGEEALAKAKAQLSASYDARFGGFGPAPKFPAPAALSLLLRDYQRSGDPRALEMVTGTLDAMKNGGIYDQVGGGFARYSTDERWLVPHFEKMLYDNAQLARVYVEAYQVTKNAEYQRVARETLDYVCREMQAPDGGYYSATDADSEGVEGKFFIWTPDEIRDVLDADAADWFCLYYEITPEGNWEGKSIPNIRRSLDSVARELGVDVPRLRANLEDSRARVYAARAERAARFIRERLVRADGGLYRTARAGKAHLDAYLEDYAYYTDALVDLYEAGAPASWLEHAEQLAERMIRDFADQDGGAFYNTAHHHESLIVRSREGHDGAVPSANAVAARALARLSYHLDREPYRELSLSAIRAYGALIERTPRAFSTALAVAIFLLAGPIEVAVVGSASDPACAALRAALSGVYLPNRVLAHAEADVAASERLPLLAGKTLVHGRPALYICENFACQAPITDSAAAAHALAEHAKRSRARAQLTGKKLPGRATASATAEYRTRFESLPAAHAELGRTGLVTSKVGFGGYRIHDAQPAHREALKHALTSGVNLVDTSTNYTDGHSESLIGQVIADLVQSSALSREQVVVVSKIGYVQGENLKVAEQRERDGKPFPEMVQYADGIWHCLHPEWLEDQLSRSLDRLGLETLDVCLLHNPEYFLSDAIKRGQGPLSTLRDTFYARIRAAFAHLEREVARGRLSFYGVSSNTVTSPADSRDATGLDRFLAEARAAGGEHHHFRVLQLPMNLVESGAVFEKNTAGGTQTVLECARETQTAVLVNRPLNAISGDQLLRLADPPDIGEAPAFDAQLERVAALEHEFQQKIAPALGSSSPDVKPEQFFTWAEQLKPLSARLSSYEQWQEIETHTVAPQVAQLFHALDDVFDDEIGATWRDWRSRYVVELEQLFMSLRKRTADRSRARTERFHSALAKVLPAEARTLPLSQKALSLLTSTPGVSCVLVGMRQPVYVDDALAALAHESLTDVERAYEAVRAADIS